LFIAALYDEAMPGYPKVEAHLKIMIDRWLDSLERDGLDKGIAVNPLGKHPARLTSDFAERDIALKGASPYHPAYDLRIGKKGEQIPTGTVAVNASVSGMVLFDGWYTGKSGRVVVVGGDNGRIQVYGHLDEASPTLHSGSRLERGKRLGFMGKTGTAETTCLHYVERQLGVQIDGRGHVIYDAVHDANDQPVMDARTQRVKAEIRRNPQGKQWDNMRFREVSGHEIAAFRRQINGGAPLSFDDFVPVAPTLGWNDQPQRVGARIDPVNPDQLRHASRYRADHPDARDKREQPPQRAYTGAAQKTVWQKAMDVACEWTGLGCAVAENPMGTPSLHVPIKTVRAESAERGR
jgi:murein DD-endopeptidase MepM/ murein hydrolase activator NlpD